MSLDGLDLQKVLNDLRGFVKFSLEIELGNDGMTSPQDVSDCLQKIAKDIGRAGTLGVGDSCRILDVNGNAVGRWRVKSLSEPNERP